MVVTKPAPNLTNHTAENYNTHATFVYSDKFTAPVLGLLNPQKGQRIADLGCGTGELTAKIQTAVGDEGYVFGVDSNADMLKKFSANHPAIPCAQVDIQELAGALDPSLQHSFDAVFTSATLHWCNKNPAGVLEGVRWLLKPGGRFIFEFGGFGNVGSVRSAIHHVLRSHGHDPIALDPWYFPTPDQYTQLLERASFSVESIENVPRPSPLDTDIIGWLKTFARNSCFSHLSEEEASQYMTEVQAIVRPDCYWSDDTPGIGIRQSGENARDGWELLYVRLRGAATMSS